VTTSALAPAHNVKLQNHMPYRLQQTFSMPPLPQQQQLSCRIP
jgi:hypothetical protein